ncbi:hypothetical protein [Haloquadratum walsbyi]|nr:hypothetical protein [Haloquadratum walsbyi]
MDATDIRDNWADCLDIPNCADVTPWVRVDTIHLADGWHVVDSNDAGPAVMAPVDTPPMAVADGGTVVPARYEDAGGLRPYYRKSMNRLSELASLSVPQIRERAEQLGDKTAEGAKERNREMALLSFMWASKAHGSVVLQTGSKGSKKASSGRRILTVLDMCVW